MSQGSRFLFFIGALTVAWYVFNPTSAPQPPAVPVAPPIKPTPAKKIKLYLFTTQWCAPCQQMKEALQDPRVQKALERFDLTITENQKLRQQYHVTGFPTLVALSTTEAVVRHEGAMSATEFVTWLEAIK